MMQPKQRSDRDVMFGGYGHQGRTRSLNAQAREVGENFPRYPSLDGMTLRRVEDWRRRAQDDYDERIDCGLKRMRSSSPGRILSHQSGGHQSLQRENLLEQDDYNDDITPWDSVSVASSRNRAMTPKNRRTIARKFDYDEMNDEGYATPESWRCDVPLRSGSKQNSTGNRSHFRSHGDHMSDASSRLLSCFDSLDYLSKKLESVTRDSSTMERFDSENYRQKPSIRDSFDANDPIDGRFDEEVLQYNEGERSSDDSSADSGINSTYDLEHSIQTAVRPGSIQARRFRPPQSGSELSKSLPKNPNHYRPLPNTPNFSRPLPTPPNHFQHLQNIPDQDDFNKNKSYMKNFHLRDNRFDGGYSSGQNMTSHSLPPHSQNSASHPHLDGYSQSPYDDSLYGGVYGSEDPYGYGTYNYASSSVYDEELHQNNGWFYLPYRQQTPTSSSSLNPHLLYPSTELSHSIIRQHQSSPIAPQVWQSHNFGSLSGTFANPSDLTSPLGAAISATCAGEYAYDTLPHKSDVNEIKVNRYVDGEFPPLSGSEHGEGRKKKSVRFSQTVQERIQTNDLTVEDSTSAMKEESKDFDKCDFESSAPSERYNSGGNMQDSTYDFPTGHVGSS